MHDSSASRFRQRAGRTRGSATILRLLPQPPPHRSRVFRDPPSRGSHTVTCRTATGTCCRVNTARRSRPGAPEAASASGASSPPRAPPPRAAGRSAPRRHLRCGGAPADSGPPAKAARGSGGPAPPRAACHALDPAQTGAAPERQRRAPLSHMLRGESLHRSQLPAAAERGGGKKKFSINDKPRNWGRGRGRRPVRES